MEIEEKVITGVDKDWVTFADPSNPEDTFRITIEVHLVAGGRKPAVGDVYRFRTAGNLAGDKFYYYVQDHVKTPEARA